MPYTFRLRTAGKSKLNATVVFDYVGMIVEKRSRGWIPARFVLFGATGLLGVIVHMAALFSLKWLAGLAFNPSLAGAVLVAMTFNFVLNNEITYGDRRLRGTRCRDRPVQVLHGLRHRCVVEHRRRRVHLRARLRLVHLRPCRRLRGRCLQLCNVEPIRLARPALS